MSEDNKDVKITTVEKVKDPKKVEAGKKLAAMSKQAKEKKATEATNRESREKQAKQEEFCLSNVDPLVALGAVGVLGLVVYHGYSRFSKKSPNQNEVTTEIENQPSTSEVARSAKAKETIKDVKNTKPKRVYRELDTLG